MRIGFAFSRLFFRAKLEETKCCLSDHQKSIQQLVKGGAESELIQRERLVERQLQKREVCIFVLVTIISSSLGARGSYL